MQVASEPMIDSFKTVLDGRHFCSPVIVNSLYLICGGWAIKARCWGPGPQIICKFRSKMSRIAAFEATTGNKDHGIWVLV